MFRLTDPASRDSGLVGLLFLKKQFRGEVPGSSNDILLEKSTYCVVETVVGEKSVEVLESNGHTHCA
jgi:hypothetical protein